VFLTAPFCEVALIANPVLQFTVASAVDCPAAEKLPAPKPVLRDTPQLAWIVPVAWTTTDSARAGVVAAAIATSKPKRHSGARHRAKKPLAPIVHTTH
jgi:hypothetical protein